jgi:hypothetical protein
MAGNAKNIIVGAAQVFISYGANNNRPDATSSSVFPFSISGSTNGGTNIAAVSTPKHLLSTASSYWRDLGFTSTGVDVSYEPGYSDVVVDQLLDAARLFQQSLKVIIKTELDEGSFENMNFVWGQQEVILNAGSGTQTVTTQWTASSSSVAASAAVAGLNIAAGALGITPMERSLVFVGNAPGTFGGTTSYPASATSGSTSVRTIATQSGASVGAYTDVSSIRGRERVYYARRIIQEQTTAHALKRDAATVFPVSFRALPEADPTRDYTSGSEYGFIIDRVYSTT